MIIRIGEQTKEFLKILDLQYPFTLEELKSHRNKVLMINHPDKGGTHEIGVKINLAFEALEPLAHESEVVTKKERLVDTPWKNDIFAQLQTCPQCLGRGTIKKDEFTEICPDCWTTRSYRTFEHIFFGYLSIKGCGAQLKICLVCNGTGKHKFRISEFCVACNGSGKSQIRCKTCMGTGEVHVSSTERTCGACKGFGKIEIKLWNPVIAKGGILNRGRKK